MRPSPASLAIAVLLALIACTDGQPPPAENPQPLTLSGVLPGGITAASVAAEAESREGPVFAVLANAVGAVGGGFELVLPAVPPVGTLAPSHDLAARLCAGAQEVDLSVTRQPQVWLELDGLWSATATELTRLRAASRSGIAFGDAGFAAGDVLHRWVYVDRSSSVTGTCRYAWGADEVEQSVALQLGAGWTTVRTEVTEAQAGVVHSFSTAAATDASEVSWFAGEPLMPAVAVQRVPNGRQHATAAWWGYHQNKLVRSGDELYLATIDDQVPAGEPRWAVVLRQDAGSEPNAWQEVARLPTSRPGQLLLQDGVAHAVVFHPTDMAVSDSIGSLRSYAIDPLGTEPDRVGIAPDTNIRFGAAVTPQGGALVAWGGVPPKFDTTPEALWVLEGILGEGLWDTLQEVGLDASFHYPFIVADDERAIVVSVENAFTGGPSNRYQQVHLWQIGLAGAVHLDQPSIEDYRDHPLAVSRPRLVEVSDLYLDGAGRAHLLVKEFLDAADPFAPELRYLVKESAADPWAEAPRPALGCDWARFLELPGGTEPVVACATFDALRVATLDGQRSVGLRQPPSMRGAYAYLAAPRSGTDTSEPMLDVLLVSGWSGAYPDGPAFLLSLERAALAQRLLP